MQAITEEEIAKKTRAVNGGIVKDKGIGKDSAKTKMSNIKARIEDIARDMATPLSTFRDVSAKGACQPKSFEPGVKYSVPLVPTSIKDTSTLEKVREDMKKGNRNPCPRGHGAGHRHNAGQETVSSR